MRDRLTATGLGNRGAAQNRGAASGFRAPLPTSQLKLLLSFFLLHQTLRHSRSTAQHPRNRGRCVYKAPYLSTFYCPLSAFSPPAYPGTGTVCAVGQGCSPPNCLPTRSSRHDLKVSVWAICYAPYASGKCTRTAQYQERKCRLRLASKLLLFMQPLYASSELRPGRASATWSLISRMSLAGALSSTTAIS